ncbi:MAG: hypothetical protein JSS81_03655 [Acidobacteria bacterium]|nr:hypothetical protein [Acidobacteriota bacterium]
MNKFKFITVVFGIIALLLFSQNSVESKNKWLIIEGEVLQIGKSPEVLCGVVAPYRIAKYKINKVIEGSYNRKEIIVDHLFCRDDVLADLTKGDQVLLVIDPERKPAEVWADGEIRKSTEKVKQFFVAYRVTKLTNCCAF